MAEGVDVLWSPQAEDGPWIGCRKDTGDLAWIDPDGAFAARSIGRARAPCGWFTARGHDVFFLTEDLAAKVPELLTALSAAPTQDDVLTISDGAHVRGVDPAVVQAVADLLRYGLSAIERSASAAKSVRRLKLTGVELDDALKMRVQLDEDSMKKVADLTRGEYFYAGNAMDLKKVYESLRTRLVMEERETEIGALFSAMAAAAVLLSATLSLLWFCRVL